MADPDEQDKRIREIITDRRDEDETVPPSVLD